MGPRAASAHRSTSAMRSRRSCAPAGRDFRAARASPERSMNSSRASNAGSREPCMVTPELRCRVDSITIVAHAAIPTLAFGLELAGAVGDAPIAGIDLRCQIMIEAARRRYDAAERERLSELFGPREAMGSPRGALLWTHAS